MSFALTSFFADGVRFSGPGPIRATQKYAFTVTAAASDVDLDLGDATGSFWSAATANSTYGEMATQVLAQVERLLAQNETVTNVFVPELYGRALVPSAPTGTQYTATINADLRLPDFSFEAGSGLTACTVVVDYLMLPNMLPSNLSYNIG